MWNDVRSDEQKRSNFRFVASPPLLAPFFPSHLFCFSLDSDGHFLVGAAIGLAESDMERVDMLVKVWSMYIIYVDLFIDKLIRAWRGV